MKAEIKDYFRTLHGTLESVSCSDHGGNALTPAAAFDHAGRLIRAATAGDNKLMMVGNGGSAGIASHMAIDFTKNGRMRALAFNDSSALTCLGNDLGYPEVFAKQIEMHGRRGDVLMAISSSGRSENILRGVEAARATGAGVITYSGFTADNPLRRLGDVNFYLAADQYGFVEIGHLALIHCLLDLMMAGVLAGKPAAHDRAVGISAEAVESVSS
jgi:D-sedoheptulose 7-phosphate isomerase